MSPRITLRPAACRPPPGAGAVVRRTGISMSSAGPLRFALARAASIAIAHGIGVVAARQGLARFFQLLVARLFNTGPDLQQAGLPLQGLDLLKKSFGLQVDDVLGFPGGLLAGRAPW